MRLGGPLFKKGISLELNVHSIPTRFRDLCSVSKRTIWFCSMVRTAAL